MKVYLAATGSYSSYRIVKVFSRREDAEAYELAEDVEEYEVHDSPAQVADRVTLHWTTWQPDKQPCMDLGESFTIGNPYITTARADRSNYPARPVPEWRRHYYGLVLEVSAWTETEAWKVYGDERAMHDSSEGTYPPNRDYLRGIA